MDQQSEHPITTPKGQTVFTVVLTVVASLAPFFGSFEFALFLSVSAVVLILWLYSAEIRGAVSGALAVRRLTAPITSVCLVGIMAAITVSTVRETDSEKDRPALTLDDVKGKIDSVGENAANKDAEMLEARDQPQIIIQPERYVTSELPTIERSEQPPAPTQSPPSRAAITDIFEESRKMANTMSAGREEYWSCLRTRTGASGSLAGLAFSASQYQNAYYYGRESKLMVSNFATWMDKVRGVFSKYETILPNISVVEAARPAERARNFLGIDNSGDNAWAEMDAKVDVLKALQKQMDDKTACERIRDTAVSQCVKLGQCTSEFEEKGAEKAN